MVSIAAFLLSARGAYRTPKGNGFTFMVMTNVRWASWPGICGVWSAA